MGVNNRKKKHPNPNPWAAHTRGDVWLWALTIGALFFAGIFLLGYCQQATHSGCLIEEKDVTSNQVETSCGVFQVSSDFGRFIFQEDERFSALQEGKEYDLVTAGWDYVNFGIHPNIISQTPVNER